MNVFSATPWVPALESRCSPAPSTNRNRSGWTSAVTIRSRSDRKRISSRRQTILIARSSEARLRFGTLTRTIGVSGGAVVVTVAGWSAVVLIGYLLVIICIITRLRCLLWSSSASRIDVPV